jgi:quercetin dioxygenase-like cupin family protein
MALELPGGVTAQVVVRGEDSDGRFCLLTDRLPAGWSLPPHRHVDESETITVGTGRLWMRVGGEEVVLGPQASVHVPAGVVHEGRVVGEESVARVVVFSPAGMERFFERLAAEELQGAAAVALALEHGWRFD